MTHFTVYYKMFVPGGHHRQPRNSSYEMSLADPASGDLIPGTAVPAPYFAQLPYPPVNPQGNAQMVFWSVTDGTTGEVLPAGPLSYTIGVNPLTVTAWYFPIGGGGPGPTLIIDDAFSANLGRFIDDTFVDVTSDPSLTSDANVVGEVPTTEAETLKAHSSVVSTPEPFYEWILSWTATPALNQTVNVPKGQVGIAVAIYQDSSSSRFHGVVPSAYNPWWWIESWWGHGPDPNPGVRDFAVAVELAAAAARASPKVRAQVIDAALQQAKIGASLMQKQLKSARTR